LCGAIRAVKEKVKGLHSSRWLSFQRNNLSPGKANTELDRVTADRTVLDHFEGRKCRVYEDPEKFATIRAFDFDILNLIHGD
jgi:hypothetical protein